MEFFLTTVLKLIPFLRVTILNCIYRSGIGTYLRYIVGGNEDVPYQNA